MNFIATTNPPVATDREAPAAHATRAMYWPQPERAAPPGGPLGQTVTTITKMPDIVVKITPAFHAQSSSIGGNERAGHRIHWKMR